MLGFRLCPIYKALTATKAYTTESFNQAKKGVPKFFACSGLFFVVEPLKPVKNRGEGGQNMLDPPRRGMLSICCDKLARSL